MENAPLREQLTRCLLINGCATIRRCSLADAALRSWTKLPMAALESQSSTDLIPAHQCPGLVFPKAAF
jgi:hypothetical protein